jgi:hypothetical protein
MVAANRARVYRRPPETLSDLKPGSRTVEVEPGPTAADRRLPGQCELCTSDVRRLAASSLPTTEPWSQAIMSKSTGLDECRHCWERYMVSMSRSRHERDPSIRSAFIRDAYVWLTRYFDAEQRETLRRERIAGRV